MQFDPKTKRDPVEIKGGTYNFTVANAQETVSQVRENLQTGMTSGGNEMIALILNVDVPGYTNYVQAFDNLVNTPGGLARIEQFAKATGLEQAFQQGTLTDQLCLDRTGKARFWMKPASDGSGRKFLAVAHYLPKDNSPDQQEAEQSVPKGSDIPF
jgi:hypothetical protein